MTPRRKVKQKYPDARISGFGYLTGLVHVITDSIVGDKKYLSEPFSTEEEAWADAAKRIQP